MQRSPVGNIVCKLDHVKSCKVQYPTGPDHLCREGTTVPGNLTRGVLLKVLVICVGKDPTGPGHL
jgi:hypothetical protein